ncbi:MAG: SprT family zinc-dependent metalloprotease [Methylococcaceae bacterium]
MNSRTIRDIEYQLLPGTDRKTTDIVIERDGLVTVRPPKHFSADQVDAVVESKRLWIYRNLAEWRDMNTTRVVREWVNGEGFLYLGCSYRLSLVTDQDEPLKLMNGRFCLRRYIIDQEGKEAAKALFERFFTDKGLERIKSRVDYFAAKVAVNPLSVTVKDLGYRWGSCSKDGKLAFHWKCMMASLKIIDYIIVHELCHLRHRDHTDAFWNEVDKVLPDYRERKESLRSNGAKFDL